MAQSNPYVSQSASGYNASPPPDDGSQSASNQVAWSKHKTKLADPIKTLSDGINSAASTAFGTIVNRMESLRPNNLIVNPGFAIAQRGTSFTSTTSPANNDDTYLLDRWILLANGNDTVDVTQTTTTVPTGSYSAIALDVETANRKFGILQIIEARDAKRIIGGTATLQFKARVSGSSLTKLRAALLSWSSTADTVTSDVVSAWNVEGTNPTLAANWTYENTGVDLTTPTTSFQTYSIEAISIDTASTTNVALFIWIENTTTTLGDFLYISDVMVQPGSVVTAYEPPAMALDLARAQRFTWQITNGGAQAEMPGFGYSDSATNGKVLFQFPVPLRTTPTLSVSAAANFDVRDGATSAASVSFALSSAAAAPLQTAYWVNVETSGRTATNPAQLLADANEWIRFDAEL